MRVSTKRILSVGLAGVFLVASFFVYSKYISATLDEVTEQRALLEGKRQLFANQKAAFQQVDGYRAQLEEKTVQTKLNLAVPNQMDSISALRQVEAAARKGGAVISGLNFKPIASRSNKQTFLKKVGVLEISISLSGTYEALKESLRLLETSARVASIKEFRFQPAGSRIGTSDVLSLNLEMYYQE
jgi:Tfp pilus assembly protein PilO